MDSAQKLTEQYRDANRAAARQGMSLFECLVCLAILTILLNVVMSIFDSGTRLSSLAIEGLDRMDGALTLQQGFTETVREAEGVTEEIGSFHSGADMVVFRMPSAGSVRRYAILGRLSQGDGLCRMDLAVSDAGIETTSFIRYPLPLASYRFSLDADKAAQARLVTFDFAIKRAPDEHARPLLHTISASVRTFVPTGKEDGHERH